MRPHIVATIALKELREALRDRRTLFMMVVLPVLLYPALLLIVSQAAAVHIADLESSVSRVAVVGDAEGHPLIDALVDDTQIEVRFAEAASLDGSTDLVVGVEAWPGIARHDAPASVTLRFDAVLDGSRQARERVSEHLDQLSEDVLLQRLESLTLPLAFLEPIDVSTINEAPPARQGGFLLASLLPLIVLITVLMGAYYPAIDLTAGEKERGTIQTLFTAPLTALEIVAGKYVAVVGIAVISGGANLLSMAAVMGQNLVLMDQLPEEFDLSISLPVLGALTLSIVFIALLFSVVMMSVAVLARSFKEAQTFMTPVYLACLVPAMVAQMPGVTWSPQLGLVPGVGAILLMKSILIDGPRVEALFLVGASTVIYTLLGLVVAARLFGQEQVIVGERGSVRLIPRRRDIRPRESPTPAEGLAWYGVLFVLLFYVGATLQARQPQVGLLATLWLVILLPTVAVSLYAKLDLRTTFGLWPTRAESFAWATCLALSSLVVVNALNGLIDAHLLQTPPELAEEMARFFPKPGSPAEWVWLLFLVAVTPAICEELVFRGFLLSSLRSRVSEWQAVVITGLLFGLFHLSIYRVFGTAVLGMLMTLVAIRTRSVFPAMLFHLLNNGLAVIVAYGFGDGLETELPAFTVALGVFGMAASLWWMRARFPAQLAAPRRSAPHSSQNE